VRQTLFNATFPNACQALNEVYRQAQLLGGVDTPELDVEEGDGGWCVYSTFPHWSYDSQDKPVTLTILANLEHPTEYTVEGFIHD
jgi:hypothetical protein